MIRNEGGVVSGDTAGLVENACFAAKYAYDGNSNILTLEPLRLVDSLTPRRLRKTVEQMIAPPRQPLLLEKGDPIYKPTPHACATYNWAIGFITNNSGGVLTYCGSNTVHGALVSYVGKINPGDNPSTHQDGFWTNQDPKDYTLGCEGSISYQLADGLTILTIYYWINTLSSYAASAALSGQNAARYVATHDIYTDFYYAAAYLYPYVTIAPA
jgi:hypothetical protein